MKVHFLSCAEQEFAEAVVHFNEQRAGLGYEFAVELGNTIDRIVSFPDAWPLFSRHTRRCLTNKFPYAILYQIKEDQLLIIAVMHMKRAPRVWEDLLEGK
ncbi:MAG: type II toxin-antitoxin system RelE/ParE family toxin [Candidatus Wallbacteria bacterium]|nr:type II toxin-antitoxin system RelE/ParE family toxin [Candidatus Wallbacteria bacterium]